MPFWKPVSVALLSLMVAAAGALAHEPKASHAAQAEAVADVPLYDNLGTLTYTITTSNPMAQRYFDQGLRLTYAFNHAEAQRAFHKAQMLDPNCAMCYWGEAFVLGPNINAPMGEEAGNPAVVAIRQAKALAARASAPEQALINALAARYADDSKAERAALNQAYADARTEALRRFPDDQDIAVLYADAVMNLSPWDYWEADGKTPKGKIGAAIQTVEKVLARHPDHPGAIHLYIHLTEASTTPQRAEPYANRLASLMPGAGHLVHMGSHTFYRVGRYSDAVEANKQAVRVDEAYLAGVKAEGIYPYGYYPHNIHFVIASAQMTGDGQTAIEYARRLEGKIPDAAAEKIGWLQPVKAAPYLAYAQFSTPDAILALPDPGNKFPIVQAAWRYARGVALAAKGEVEPAQKETALLAELTQKTDFSYLQAWGVPGPDILRIARHVLEGRIAQAQNDTARTIKEFETAVSIQDSLGYMEPPYWYYPVRQSLGAALLAAGKPAEAEQAFKKSLEQFPNNSWSLYGLVQAQQAQGNTAAAQETEKRFKQAWTGPANALSLGRL
jgi:tetratricopeptide (TPR) repeat protein